jgi:signal transduction histidine kinase
MSTSFDSIYKKLASSLEQGGNGQLPEPRIDPARQISPVVAHELNNIITIIMGYGERLLLKHGAQDPAMEAHLKLIVEASRRAATIVRDATPPNASRMIGVNGLRK